MRSHRIAFIVIALLAGAAAARAENPQSQRFVVPLSRPGQAVRLEVSLISGGISVQPRAGNDVIVEAVAGGEGDDDEHESRGPAGMHRLPNRSLGLVVEEDANHVTIGNAGIPHEVTLRIQVPRNTSVALTTVNGGDITVEGLEGTLELNNTNGAITARDVAGSVVAHTTNGDVKISMTRVDGCASTL